MTTSPPAAALSATEVCRIGVEGPAGRADLAVPVSTPVSALLPVLIRHVTAAGDGRGTPWVLQRLGEEPLDPDGTPETLGLRHGDVLYLRPADAPLDALQFDDVSDGVAHVVSGLPGRWRPELTRRLALGMACLGLVAVAVALLGAGPGRVTAGCAGAIALLLAIGTVVAARTGVHAGSVMVAGLGTLAFAGLAGLTLRVGPHGGYAPGVNGVLLAAACVVVLAALLLATRSLPFLVPGAVLFTGLAAAVGTALMHAVNWHGEQAVATVAIGMFVLGHFGPRLALRAARLRVPQLPHNAQELQQDIDPEPEERIALRVAKATDYLNALSLSSAVVYAVASWYMAQESGWVGTALPLVFAGAVLLHSRGITGTLQRVPMTVAGGIGLAVVLLVRLAGNGATDRGVVLALLLIGVVLLLVAAWRLPTGRLLPVWGQTGDTLQMLSTIALLPLLLQALHAYAYFRSLAG